MYNHLLMVVRTPWIPDDNTPETWVEGHDRIGDQWKLNRREFISKITGAAAWVLASQVTPAAAQWPAEAAERLQEPLTRQEIRTWMEAQWFPQAIERAFREEMEAQWFAEWSWDYRIYADDFLDWDYVVEDLLLWVHRIEWVDLAIIERIDDDLILNLARDIENWWLDYWSRVAEWEFIPLWNLIVRAIRRLEERNAADRERNAADRELNRRLDEFLQRFWV